MEQAKFYSNISGFSDGKAYFIKAQDGVRLRLVVYEPKGTAKGTIFLMLGRFGYAERYGIVAKSFAEKGYYTAVVDWRSQGLSDRVAKDPKAGHILDFADYQKDVRAVMDCISTLSLPRPLHLLGVSMGACIGLRSVLDGLEFHSCAFISPMWGIRMSIAERIAAWPVSWASHHLGFGERYVPGESSDIYVLETPFSDNNLTNNPDMYSYWVSQAQACPELQIGGPTLSWLYSALKECNSLSRVQSPQIPCVTFCGELDELVDNNAIKARMARWPMSGFHFIPGAKHDVLTEKYPPERDVIEQIFNFFES